MSNCYVVTAAYGNVYVDSIAAKQAFKDGDDFVLRRGPHSMYCSIRSFKPNDLIEIRWMNGKNSDWQMAVVKPSDFE